MAMKLKTLYDLTWIKGLIEDKLENGEMKVTKERIEHDDIVKVEDLKQEAIKWIKSKFPIHNIPDINSYKNLSEWMEICIQTRENMSLKLLFMKFFNIKDSDLK